MEIKSIPYITNIGEIVSVPGPWSLRPPVIVDDAIALDGAEDEESDEEEIEDDDDDLPHGMSVGNGNGIGGLASLSRSQSITSANASMASFSNDKFVVRNEFGHARIQPLLDLIDSLYDDGIIATIPCPSKLSKVEIGGHCVLPEAVFLLCIEKGWGQKHPFAGRFHPIAGTMIPEETLLFFSPRDTEELEILWKIVRCSYAWALSHYEDTV